MCVTLISLHRDKKVDGWRIRILDLTWLDPPYPPPSPLNNNNTCTAQVTTHPVTQSFSHLTAWSCTWGSPIRFCSSGNILVAIILVFSNESSRQRVVQPVRRKKCPNDPGFKSQVKCPVPFYPHGNGGSGDWPSSNQSPLFCHCYSSCVLWQENILTELTYLCREPNQEYRKESL